MRRIGVLSREDLSTLTKQDLLDIVNVIHVAHSHIKLSEMRSRLVRSLKQTFQAQGVAFFLGDRDCNAIDNTSMVSVGTDLRYLDSWVRHYSHYDPFQREGYSRSVVCKVDDILPYNRWVNLKIYNEFYRPQNIHYKLSICLRSSDKVFGLIGIFRPKEHRDFSRREMAKARILVPHITTALENIIRLSEADGSKSLFWECNHELPLFGVIMLDYELQPLYWNSEAKKFCLALYREQQPQFNEMKAEDPPIPSEILQDCLALKGLRQSANHPVSLNRQRIIDAGQNKRFQMISSLIEHSFHEVSYRSFVIYLLDFSEICKGKEEILREEYQLTNREIDIVRCVYQGLTNNEIGERLFISRFTVETHLKNIFDKTKVKRRTALASLLQSL
jgi:DNA-binding CsgD family transcriptional regulator